MTTVVAGTMTGTFMRTKDLVKHNVVAPVSRTKDSKAAMREVSSLAVKKAHLRNGWLRCCWYACLVCITWGCCMIQVRARPDGAPECPEGPAVGEDHLDGNEVTGSLADGGIVVRLDNQILQAETPLELQLDRNYTVTVERTTGSFRGILWRTGRGDTFGSGGTQFVVDAQGSQLVKVSQPCIELGLGGITHTSAVDKTSVSFSLKFEDLAFGIPIDLTVVVSNPPSEFYHSQLLVRPTLSIDETPRPTDPIVTSPPTQVNSTKPPTTSPTQSPTDAPTSSSLPTMEPSTGQPSFDPSESPITPPSIAPSSIPSTVPTPRATTMTPTQFPTETPLSTIYSLLVTSNLTVVELVNQLEDGFIPIIDTEAASQTFFAPANEVFESLHPRLDRYLRSDVITLFGVLLRHTVEGVVFAEDLRARNRLDLRSEEEVAVSVTTEGDVVVDKAKIITADQVATNGVLHIVDRFILLPTLQEYLAETNPTFLGYLLSSSFLDELLAAKGATLFIPSPTSLEGLSATHPDLAAVVFSDPAYSLHLFSILAAHSAQGMLFFNDLTIGQSLSIFTGESITVTNMATTVPPNFTLSTGATTLVTDIVTLDAIAHVVDSLLPPPFLTTSLVNIITTMAPTLSSLLELAGLDEVLSSAFGLTSKCDIVRRPKNHHVTFLTT